MIPGKGHDVLLDALAHADATCPGDCRVRRQPRPRPGVRRARSGAGVASRGLDGRVRFPGRGRGADLARSYAAADLLVLPSRAETYGMVVTEALARGLPVVAAEVGGVPEALGHGADGARPGPARAARRPGRAGAARCAPGSADAELRERLRRAARERRASLSALVDHDVRRRRRARGSGAMTGRGDPRSAPTGSPCASRPTRPPGRASSSTQLRPATLRRRGRWWSTTSPAAPGRWAAGSRRSCPGRSTGCCTTATPTCWQVAARRPSRPGRRRRSGHRRDAAVRHHPARRRTTSPARPGHRLGAARPADRRTSWPALVGVCARPRCPVLLTLSVAGRVELAPADPLDARVAAAFDAHQRRATRRGRLLGPDAVEAAADGVPPARRRGHRPAEPVAARRRRGGPGRRVARRLGRRRVRAGARAGRRRRRVSRAGV